MSEEVASTEAASSAPQPRPRASRPAPPPRAAAVVLAGGRADDAFRSATGVENRALAPVAGRPMVAWVLDALAAAETVDRVVLVGAEGLADAPGVRQRLRGGSDLVETMERGLGACPGAERVLLVSADIPALTPVAVDTFIRDGIAADADLVYPVIPRAANEAQFPGTRRTYLRLADGLFTGGNMFLVRPEALLRQREVIRRAHAARKKPLRLAAMVGWGVLWRLLWRRLTLAQAEAAVARLMGLSVRALSTEHAEVGADVDRAGDLEMMARYLEHHPPRQQPP